MTRKASQKFEGLFYFFSIYNTLFPKFISAAKLTKSSEITR
nr:MAG TPA: hypothetical protein [Caudoviricetes sp.]